MAQLNLYVPNDLAGRLKREAHQAGMSLSSYMLSLLSAHCAGEWPAGYFETACGFLQEEMAEPEDRLPEPVETLEVRG